MNTATYTDQITGQTITLKANHYGTRDYIAAVASLYAEEYAAEVGGVVFGGLTHHIEIRETESFSSKLLATVTY